MKRALFFLLILYLSTPVFSQVVYSDPALPTADEPVIIYFNAEGTGLDGYTGDVYTHTGITIDNNRWQHVIGSWGNNSTQPQLTRLDDNLYKLDIDPSIREYYEASSSDNITELCFVFF